MHTTGARRIPDTHGSTIELAVSVANDEKLSVLR